MDEETRGDDTERRRGPTRTYTHRRANERRSQNSGDHRSSESANATHKGATAKTTRRKHFSTSVPLAIAFLVSRTWASRARSSIDRVTERASLHRCKKKKTKSCNARSQLSCERKSSRWTSLHDLTEHRPWRLYLHKTMSGKKCRAHNTGKMLTSSFPFLCPKALDRRANLDEERLVRKTRAY
jgi:hypothetical protein